VGGVWTLTEELDALPPDFPPALRRSFAAATRGGDLRGAFYDACFHVRHHRSQVVRWSRRIAARAPNVARTLVGALQRERQRHDHAPHRGWVWWLAAPLMVGFVRLLASGLDGGSPSPGGAAVPSVQAPLVALGPSRQPWADMLHEAVSTLCDRPRSPGDHITCDQSRAFESAVATHDCPQARALRERLRQDLGEQTPSPNESRILARGDLAMWQFCRRSAAGPDSPGESPP